MQRALFVKVATKTLMMMGDPLAAAKAEAIAVQMDFMADMMGPEEGAGQTSPPPAPRPVERMSFPAVNPSAISQVPAEEPQYMVGMDGAIPPPDPEPLGMAGLNQPPSSGLIVTDLRASRNIPAPEPVRSLRNAPQLQGKMKVEDLNLLVQRNTPERMRVEVPLADGRTQSMLFDRNVISRHNYDCVQLVYYPAGAVGSTRESTEVTREIHIEEAAGLDIGRVLRDLSKAAADGLRPRGPIVAREPDHPGFVQHPADYKDPNTAAISQNTQAVFNGMG